MNSLSLVQKESDAYSVSEVKVKNRLDFSNSENYMLIYGCEKFNMLLSDCEVKLFFAVKRSLYPKAGLVFGSYWCIFMLEEA